MAIDRKTEPQVHHYFVAPSARFPFSPAVAFRALSMARVAAKAAMSFEREKPVCILVGPRCAIHFQPEGLVICTSSYLTPRCSMLEQPLTCSKVPFEPDRKFAPFHAAVPEPSDSDMILSGLNRAGLTLAQPHMIPR